MPSNQGNHRYLEAQLIPAKIVEGKGWRCEKILPSANCPLAIFQVFASVTDDVVPAAICTNACSNLNDFSTAAA